MAAGPDTPGLGSEQSGARQDYASSGMERRCERDAAGSPLQFDNPYQEDVQARRGSRRPKRQEMVLLADSSGEPRHMDYLSSAAPGSPR